jgi:transposase
MNTSKNEERTSTSEGTGTNELFHSTADKQISLDMSSRNKKTYRKISDQWRSLIIDNVDRQRRSIKEVSQIFDVPKSTIYHILKRFYDTGEKTVRQRGGYKRKLLTDKELTTLQTWIDNGCSMPLSRLQYKISAEFGKNVSITTIRNYISGFQYRPKRIQIIK